MKMENNQLPRLNFDQAKRAKNVGFDWPTIELITPDNKVWSPENIHKAHSGDYGFGTFIKCPENALFLQWARKTKEMHGLVYPDQRENMEGKWAFSIECLEDGSWGASSGMEGLFDTYLQAETALIDEILNILEKQ
jgi:hypothetical protein